jgi:TRAP-type mannitol/chloroaromatic compound transport system permease small subunit
LFLVCSGFMGLHRFYLRSYCGFAYIPVFLLALHLSDTIRDHREDVSRTHAAYETAIIAHNRAKIPTGVEATPAMTERLSKAQAEETQTKKEADVELKEMNRWQSYSHWVAILLGVMVLIDALLLPGMVRRQREREAAERKPEEIHPPEIAPIGTAEDPTLHMHTRITDKLEWFNVRIGEFVAYWALISVFVYYYEVIARYVFNSPTNWVHESMFLMYGMQYMLCGAYAYREDQHVRVDVFYSKFSPRGKAIADIFTSLFFFIFLGTMFWTGARFAMDAINNSEVSFTEWGIQYWPVKLALPIGAALMLLQGLSKLIKDIVFLSSSRRA